MQWKLSRGRHGQMHNGLPWAVAVLLLTAAGVAFAYLQYREAVRANAKTAASAAQPNSGQDGVDDAVRSPTARAASVREPVADPSPGSAQTLPPPATSVPTAAGDSPRPRTGITVLDIRVGVVEYAVHGVSDGGGGLLFRPPVPGWDGRPVAIRLRDGKYLVSATLGDKPRTSVHVVDNVMVGGPPGYGCNYDDRMLEVGDGEGLCVLQVYFLADDRLAVRGSFDLGGTFGFMDWDGSRATAGRVDRLPSVGEAQFRYPFAQYPHRRWHRWAPEDDPQVKWPRAVDGGDIAG